MSYLDALIDRVVAPQRCVAPLVRPADALAEELDAPLVELHEFAGPMSSPAPAQTPAAPGVPGQGARRAPVEVRARPASPDAAPTPQPSRSSSATILAPTPTRAPTVSAPPIIIERGPSVEAPAPVIEARPTREIVTERVVETQTALERALEYVRGGPAVQAGPTPAPAATTSTPAAAAQARPAPSPAKALAPPPSPAITPPPQARPAPPPSAGPGPRERSVRAEPGPIVRVSIDRVIVVAEAPAPAPARRREAPAHVGLDEYLSRRERDR